MTPTSGICGVATSPVPQHMTALAKANNVRFNRARLLRQLTAGEITVLDLLHEPAMATCTVYRMLATQWRWGPGRAIRALNSVHMSTSLTVGKLTDRQRRLLLEAIRRHQPGAR